MRKLLFLLPLLFFSFTKDNDRAVVTGFKASGKEIALTFDACEDRHKMTFDSGLVKFIEENKVPVTIFLAGRFAEDNAAEIKRLSRYPFINFGNHSMHHYLHMNKLPNDKLISEVVKAQQYITRLTGKAPKYFRFPAGNYDEHALHVVDSLGLEVVHWTYPSGDPDKRITSDMLIKDALWRAHSGQILIYHINGRGVGTDAALPVIYKDLTEKGYRFVSLDAALH